MVHSKHPCNGESRKTNKSRLSTQVLKSQIDEILVSISEEKAKLRDSDRTRGEPREGSRRRPTVRRNQDSFETLGRGRVGPPTKPWPRKRGGESRGFRGEGVAIRENKSEVHGKNQNKHKKAFFLHLFLVQTGQ